MDEKKALKTKLAAIAILAVILVLVGISYSNSFDNTKKVELIKERYAEFEKMGIKMPEGCTMLDGRLQGGPLTYGIDARLITVLDITGMSTGDTLNDSTESVKLYYAEELRSWHPGYLKLGRSGTALTVFGPAGLAMVEVSSFWYGDVADGKVGAKTAEIITAKVTPKEGRGRRYAIVNIVVCTRP